MSTSVSVRLPGAVIRELDDWISAVEAARTKSDLYWDGRCYNRSTLLRTLIEHAIRDIRRDRHGAEWLSWLGLMDDQRKKNQRKETTTKTR